MRFENFGQYYYPQVVTTPGVDIFRPNLNRSDRITTANLLQSLLTASG
jgi:hypothetical protein